MGVIYLRTNTVNGMQYVGQSKDFKTRERQWKCLKLRYANQLLTDDRERYGLDAFETKILIECPDEELDYYEKKYIEELNTIYPSGYNANEGGAISFKCSDITKEKISKANKGENNGMFGKTPWNKGLDWPDDVREKLSKSHVGVQAGEKHPLWGTHHSDETKKKISEKKKGKPNAKLSKPVYQYTLEGEFIKMWPSVAECSKNGFHHVADCCRGKRKQDKGYIWSYIPL